MNRRRRGFLPWLHLYLTWTDAVCVLCALLVFVCAMFGAKLAAGPVCRLLQDEHRRETVITLDTDNTVKLLTGTPFRVVKLALSTASDGIVLFRNPITSSLSFVSHTSDSTFGSDVFVVAGHRMVLPVHTKYEIDAGPWTELSLLPPGCDGIFGIGGDSEIMTKHWRSYSIHCSSVVLGASDHSECADKTARWIPVGDWGAIGATPVCAVLDAHRGPFQSAYFHACFDYDAPVTSVPSDTLSRRLTRREIGLTLCDNPTPDDIDDECECPADMRDHLLIQQSDGPAHLHHPQQAVNGSCDVAFGRDMMEMLALRYDADDDVFSLSECTNCMRWESDITISMCILIAIVLSWMSVIVPHRITTSRMMLLSIVIQFYGHFTALCLFLSTCIGRKNGMNIQHFSGVHHAFVDAITAIGIVVPTVFNMIGVVWELLLVQGIRAVGNPNDESRTWKLAARIFEETRLYHRFLFEICMLTITWYCCMEVRDYTLRTVYVLLISVALCCDINSLAISAALTRAPLGLVMALVSFVIDIIITLLCTIPLLKALFPCEIVVFPLSFAFLFLFAIGPAMMLALLSTVYELKNSKL